ncbi:hypothetical protein B2J93_6375 [Marssonina coronariae]|uniref:Uncharacterized protein n=1 Tax=Diplocarpon coronariae TaxID=2795749 RepID=A0A218ZBT0_9HELO|nr:hypothetical protein B2J93_6375 [Marssonina coronariae]
MAAASQPHGGGESTMTSRRMPLSSHLVSSHALPPLPLPSRHPAGSAGENGETSHPKPVSSFAVYVLVASSAWVPRTRLDLPGARVVRGSRTGTGTGAGAVKDLPPEG